MTEPASTSDDAFARVRWLPRIAGAYALLGGLISFLGWCLAMPRLADWQGNGITMKVNAALAAAAAGLAVICAPRILHSAIARIVVTTLGAVVAFLGGATLVEHAFNADFGIDTLLFNEPAGAIATDSPGRMGPPASTSYLLIGAALLLLTALRSRGLAAALGVAVCAIATLSITGHLYGAKSMYMLPGISGIALQTASMLFAIGLGIAAAAPDRQPMRALAEDSAAGTLARYALPVIIILPLLLGGIRVWSQERGLVDTALGTALRTVIEVALLCGLLAWCVRMVGQHERALREQRDRTRQQRRLYESILTNTPDLAYVFDREHRFIYANDVLLRMWGRTWDEAIGKTCLELGYKPSHAAMHDREIDEVIATKAPVRGEVAFDGTFGHRLYDYIFVPVLNAAGEVEAIAGTTRDITERNQAEESRAALAAIVEASDDAMISKTIDGTIRSWNIGAERLFGYTAAEAVGRSIEMIIPPERKAEERAILDRLKKGERIAHFETVRIAKGGRRVNISLSISPLRDESGRVIGASKVARDITARKRAEEAVLHQKTLLEGLTESVLDGILIVSPEGRMIQMNQRFLDIWKFPQAVLDSGSDDAALDWAAQQTTDPSGFLDRVESIYGQPDQQVREEVALKDGRVFERCGSSIRRGDMRLGWVWTFRDITDRKRVEEQLARQAELLEEAVRETTIKLEESHTKQRASERMAALGTLAAGLGHDMSNLVLPLEARINTLEREPLSPRALEDIQGVKASITYLRNLSRSLRMLAQDATVEDAGSQTSIRAWWPQTLPLLKAVLPRGVKLESDIDASAAEGDGLIVASSPHQLTQIVFNLVQNAGEAIELAKIEGGVVRVSAMRTAPADSEPAGMVRLNVSDNGPGMSEETRLRCMEPFYSTKHRGVGGGMGLSLVASIVQLLQGRVDVATIAGEGATFSVVLPASSEGLDQWQGGESIGTIAVSVSDSRMRGVIDWMLRAHRVAAAHADGSPPEGATGWIVDAEHAAAAQAFAANNGRWAVILGDISVDSPDRAESSLSVMHTGTRPTPAKIREVLMQAFVRFAHAERNPDGSRNATDHSQR